MLRSSAPTTTDSATLRLSMLRSLFPTNHIDVKLSRLLGGADIGSFSIFTRRFPIYRCVDLFRAVKRYCESLPHSHRLDTENGLDLNTICHSRFYGQHQRLLSVPSKVSKPVDYDTEEFFPTDQFWTAAESEENNGTFKAILRVKLAEYNGEVIVELATNLPSRADAIVEGIIRASIEQSIYRNKLLQISFDAGVKDEYGDVDTGGQVQLTFRQENPVSEDDIVLDHDIAAVLQRNVFDFHARRDLLKRHGIPLRKGVLFFGPPGTGKTFTCQYIYSQLKPVTTLVVTGQSLLQVKSICNLARMLQPALLVLEDVDLIFSSREINLYSTALGDLMDEMDGFQKDESVTFLLTTNAIDRLEEAIKDRPGRINQCIYFGHPNAELRGRYITRYLRGYDDSGTDLERVVEITKGTSQAFIKELIYRAVQISLEGVDDDGEPQLTTPHFEEAFDEMTSHAEHAAGRIMGFKTD